MIFGHNPLGEFHYYFLKFKKCSFIYGVKKIEYRVHAYAVLHCKKIEKNGSLQRNNI